MTFSGFVFNCLAYLLCWQLLRNLSLTPANRNPEAGNWVPLAAGGLTCAYMLADAMDGKQARRTKTSSCLGEIMDHTVDAFFVQFGTFSLAYCIGLDFTEIFVAVAVGVVSFYLAHWEELFVEHLVLGPLTGPTELLIAAISVYVVTYFFGHSFWDSVAFSLDFGPDFLRGAYDVRTIAFFVIVGGAASAGLSSLFNGLRQAFSRGKSFPEALRPMAPFLLYLVASAVWLRLSWSHYLQAPDNAHAYIHTLGTVFCLVCSRLIVDRITLTPTKWFYYCELSLLFVAADVAFLTLLSPGQRLLLVGVSAVLEFLHFSFNVSLQIADIQNIFVFRVGRPRKT